MRRIFGVVSLIRSVGIGLWRRAAADIGFWLAAGDKKSCVHIVIDGDAPTTDKICIFVHFDASGKLPPHTRRYVEAIIDEGFCVIFVSNSPLRELEIAQLKKYCTRILLRTNRGYDFAAYRDGILSLNIENTSPSIILLANDSVYAPIAPLANLFGAMAFDRADVWAATDSWQSQYHLQSYFLAFGATALSHPAFLEFWREVRNTRSKWAVVKHYEIGMASWLMAAGLRCAAVFEYQSLIRRAEAIAEQADEPKPFTMAAMFRNSAESALEASARRIATNPVIDLWPLLAEAGAPFVKRELLRDDPTQTSGLNVWHRIVQNQAPLLYQEIIEDLKRVMRRSAP